MPFLTHLFVILGAAAAGVAISVLEIPEDPEMRKLLELVLMLIAMGTLGAVVVEIGGLN